MAICRCGKPSCTCCMSRRSCTAPVWGKPCFDGVVAGRPCSLWVAEGNARALAFYRRQGFQPDGTRKTVTEWEGLVTIRMVR